MLVQIVVQRLLHEARPRRALQGHREGARQADVLQRTHRRGAQAREGGEGQEARAGESPRTTERDDCRLREQKNLIDSYLTTVPLELGKHIYYVTYSILQWSFYNVAEQLSLSEIAKGYLKNAC